MLSKDRRLNLAKDFKWVVTGRKLESRYLKLFIKEGHNETTKVGVASSGKIFKKASLRNRARRLASVALETLYDSFSPGVNILALPKEGILKVKSKDVLEDLKETLRKT